MIGAMENQTDGGGANVTRRKMPDLDFDDVFGGAPNHFRSRSDSEPYRQRGVRHLGDGFFDDIFRGGASSSSSAQLSLRDPQNQEIRDYGLSAEDSTGNEDAAGIKFTEHSTLVEFQRIPLWTSASAESGKQEAYTNFSFETAVRIDFPCKLNRSMPCLLVEQENHKIYSLNPFTDGKPVAGSQFSSLDLTNTFQNQDIEVSEQNQVITADSARIDDETVEIKGPKVITTVGAPSKAKEVPIFLEEKVISGRIWEKVKNFLKNFHQDFSCKSIDYVEPQYRTSKVKEVRNNIVEDPAKAREINAEIDEEISPGGHGLAQSSATIAIDENPWNPKPETATLAVDQEVLVTSQRHCATAWDIDSILENIDELYADIEEPRNKIEDHMVEILNWEHNDLLPSVSRLKEDQNADMILREWLSGREGNIRSLLSTLQHVLWPGSGWKTIPLVDLVEITSVRKAYLKALLSLHPDKLQQMGAATHQKYIAEKVFDVLQEAWSQFTSISPI